MSSIAVPYFDLNSFVLTIFGLNHIRFSKIKDQVITAAPIISISKDVIIPLLVVN